MSLIPLGDAELQEPDGVVQPEGAARHLEALRAAVVHRRGDLAEVRAELGAVDAAERRLQQASSALGAAEAEADARQQRASRLRQAQDRALTDWRDALTAWLDQVGEHRSTRGLGPVAAPDLLVDLGGRRQAVEAALADVAEEAITHHRDASAVLKATRRSQQAIADDAATELAELEARTLPDPPGQAWQRGDRGPVLAELVDFREDVEPAAKAGLEAALEASGLLGAEMVADGSLQVGPGALVVRPGATVPDPLSLLLTVTGSLDSSTDPEQVSRLLGCISLAPEDLEADEERTVVTTGGRFRVGVLVGEHAKAEAEHIGLAARRASLERLRAESRLRHDRALADLAAADRELEAGRAALAEARSIRAGLPSATALAQAMLAVELADSDAASSQLLAAERRVAMHQADDAHVESVEKSPPDRRQPGPARRCRRARDGR